MDKIMLIIKFLRNTLIQLKLWDQNVHHMTLLKIYGIIWEIHSVLTVNIN
jgi:hypothetical protein